MQRRRSYCCSESCIDLAYYINSISFHLVPKDPELRKKWVEILRIPKRLVNHPHYSKNLKVCCNHFTPEDYHILGQRKMLKPNSVPSQNLEKGMVGSIAPENAIIKKVKGLESDDEEWPTEAPEVSEPPPKEESDHEEESEPRGRPKRRAAQAAAKKMIEVTSKEIDYIIRAEGRLPSPSANASPAVKAQKKGDVTKLRTSDGRVVYLKDMVVLKKQQHSSPKMPNVSNSVSITAVKNTPQKARKSFPSANLGSGSKSPLGAPKPLKNVPFSAYKRRMNNEIELDLICEDEALSTHQIKAHNEAVMEYQKIMSKIKKFMADKCTVKYENNPY